MSALLDILNQPVARLVFGVVAAAFVAYAAYRARSLSVSGAVAATVVGGAIVAGAGWWAGLVLVVYFASSSALSHISARRKPTTDQVRGKRRDAIQVLANGGVAALLALACILVSNSEAIQIGVYVAIAAATADTWATELGRLGRRSPRLITTGRRAAPGTSGAISLAGTSAALLGAAFIAVLAIPGLRLAENYTMPGIFAFLLVTLAGFGGAIVDSFLGATVQHRRWCPTCRLPTEQIVHTCNTRTEPVSGPEWLNNDTVNAAAIAAAAIVSLLVAVR